MKHLGIALLALTLGVACATEEMPADDVADDVAAKANPACTDACWDDYWIGVDACDFAYDVCKWLHNDDVSFCIPKFLTCEKKVDGRFQGCMAGCGANVADETVNR